MIWQGRRKTGAPTPKRATSGTMAPVPQQTSRQQSESEPLYSRNWAFVNPDLQAALAKTTICTVGAGLGGIITLLAARTGFQRFVLADGDIVEESNLNRQPFLRGQLGQNKASATAALISTVAPSASCIIMPKFLQAPDFEEIVPQSDLIINTIDMDSLAFLDLNRVAMKANKTVLFPINIGWGGGLLVFTPDSMSLDEFIDNATGNDVATAVVYGILKRMPGGIPQYLRDLLPSYLNRSKDTWSYDPQLGVAAHVTAALAVRAAVALTAGEPVRKAPELVWCDTLVSLASPVTPAPQESAKVDRAEMELAVD